MSLPYSSLPQAMVVDVKLLQVTVCMLPVETTVVKQLRKRSSGQRQVTLVLEPNTVVAGAAVAAAATVVDPELGRHAAPPTFALIDLMFITPDTGLHLTLSVTSLKTSLQEATF